MTNLDIASSFKDVTTTISINEFQSVDNPKVYDSVPIYKILAVIKNGDNNLHIIEKARMYGKGTEQYDKIKAHYLPSYRFNFLFDKYATNQNIIAPTGLIYLDADNIDTIPDSEYIFAKWKSLSGLGYGILVRVNGLNIENYRDTYNSLASLIGIEADSGGRKATQQTVLSYDPNLYHNEESKVYVCKKVSLAKINKERKGITTNDTFFDEGRIRFNNIEDFFVDDTPYLVYPDKVCVCTPYIPRVIKEGKRNNTMFHILSMYAILNPLKETFLFSIAKQISNNVQPPLSIEEVNKIVRNVIQAKRTNSLGNCCTHLRKILFNPRHPLSFKEKMGIVAIINGTERSQRTIELIYAVLDNWDYEINGKITQKKVAKLIRRGIATVKRHWKHFEDYK